MLYYLFEFLEKQYTFPGTGVFHYITFRAGLAIILSLIISMLFGRRIISSLKRLQVGEQVRELGLEGQTAKQGTPTMGGLIIMLATLVPCLLLADLGNVYVILMILATVWMGAIGFIDDYIKVFRNDKRGLHGKFKVLGQVGLGCIIGITMLAHDDIVVRVSPAEARAGNYEIIDTVVTRLPTGDLHEMFYVKATLTNVPFLKGNRLDYKWFVNFLGDNADLAVWFLFIILSILIVTAVSNGANLTDGLDGLATGTSAIIGATLAALAYVSGHNVIADYLNILYLPYTGELVIFSGCFVGACIGFLWYNAFPAKVFMGDTGSLMIGGVIAALAILIRKELLIPLLCGIFLVENLSVILQVYYFKYTRKKYGEGRRIFRMSPLHHHYQKAGMHESQIVTRFWIVGILLAVLTIITLKVR
jgi:phospho-N-acetylmuramoyl-pentapeptide-transferase